MIAQGTQSDPIIFTSDSIGDWIGLHWEPGSDGVIEHSTIENGYVGLSCNSSSPTISNNLIRNNDELLTRAETRVETTWVAIDTFVVETLKVVVPLKRGAGILCEEGASPTITNNTIEYNLPIGILSKNSSLIIEGNTIRNNGLIRSAAPKTIRFDYIEAGLATGIHCEGGNPVIHNNIIANNLNTGVFLTCSKNRSSSTT